MNLELGSVISRYSALFSFGILRHYGLFKSKLSTPPLTAIKLDALLFEYHIEKLVIIIPYHSKKVIGKLSCLPIYSVEMRKMQIKYRPPTLWVLLLIFQNKNSSHSKPFFSSEK